MTQQSSIDIKDFKVEVVEVRTAPNGDFKEEMKEVRRFGAIEFRYKYRHYFAEFFGMAIFLAFGNGIVASVFFSPGVESVAWMAIVLGFGFAIMMALFVSMGASGGHLNPAVTVSLALFGRFPWSKVPGYIFAQLSGAFVGAALAYASYRSKFDAFDGGKRQSIGPKGTAPIFAGFADPANTKWDSFYNEILCTAVLLFVLQSFFEERIMPAKGYEPIAVGILLSTIIFAFGQMTGPSMNPARDLGPRLFALCAGWGTGPFTSDGYFFWIPMTAPFIGGAIGVALYEFFIIPNMD